LLDFEAIFRHQQKTGEIPTDIALMRRLGELEQ
jgi:hypothetical protein